MEVRKIENLDQPVHVPEGAIGVVAEVGAVVFSTLLVYHIVFPGRPLVSAREYPDGLKVVSRVLTTLSPGESLPIRSAGTWTAKKEIVTNCNGKAKVERGGFFRHILGPATKYKSADDAPPPRL